MRWWMLGFMVLAACHGGESTTRCDCWDTATYLPPVACAGEDQVIELGQSAWVDASCTHHHFSWPELTYTWHFEGMPLDSELSDDVFGESNGTADAQRLSWLPDVLGQYAIALEVDDESDCPGTTMDVTVVEG